MLSFPIKPMLLKSTDYPFDSEDNIFELKVDGIRCLMFYEKKGIRLQSKSGRDCSQAFPELNPLMNTDEAVLDGEVTVFNNGKPDFESVMERYHAGKMKLDSLVMKKPAAYIVWDILWNEGLSVMNFPLVQRKSLLNEVLEDNEFVLKIDWVDTHGVALFDAIKDHGLEGIVAKKKNSRYVPGRRSSAWIKTKAFQSVVVNVFGYAKKDGAVLVGTGGRVEGHAIGMGLAERKVFWEILNLYGTDKKTVVWLPPGVQGRVKFTTWSTRGNMRDCCWERFISEPGES